jgi:8-oxo-dGTP pyrophosphatase MutT (NUDIX family)
MISDPACGRQNWEKRLSEPYVTDVYGRFTPDQLQIRWTDEVRPPQAALDDLVARVWREQMEACRLAGRLLFNGAMVRYLRHEVRDGVFHIGAGPTDFANFLATNLLNWQRGEELGWDLFSNALGCSTLPVTADGRLVLGRRSDRVIFHAGYVHVIGGGLEGKDRREDGTVDGFVAAQRELLEELLLEPSEIGEMVCLGMIEDRTIRQPELIFEAKLNLTWEEVVARMDPNDPHQEHTLLLPCADEPGAIAAFIRDQAPVTPVAMGLLKLHSQSRFDE